MDFNEKIIKNTLVDYPRLEVLRDICEQMKGSAGCIAEVGVYKGGTAFLLAEQFPGTFLLLFDTFEGMPQPDKDKDHHEKGDFSDTSEEHVKELLKNFNNIFIHKGVFPDSVPKINGYYNQYFLVHLDCDIYQSVKDGLEFFYPRLTKGGIIVLDDYNAPDCLGAKLAADEFVYNKAAQIIPTVQCQAILKKLG